jgi:hypothetical protein
MERIGRLRIAALRTPLAWAVVILATTNATGSAQGLPGEIDPAAAQAVRKTCQTDYEAHCTGKSPSISSEIACLRQHYTSLSQACRTALQRVKASP